MFRYASRRKPNQVVADAVYDEVSQVLAKSRELSQELFRRKIDDTGLGMYRDPTQFPRMGAIDRAISSKDYAEIEKHSAKLLTKMVEEFRDEIEWAFGYMLPAIHHLSKLLKRGDVYGESGLRKYKLGWSKFKKLAREDWDKVVPFKILSKELQETEKEVEGIRLLFVRSSGNFLAQTSKRDRSIRINLAQDFNLASGRRTLRAVLEHELIHILQIDSDDADVGSHSSFDYGSGYEGHSLADIEYDPRINDSCHAVQLLMEDYGNDFDMAVKKVIGDLPPRIEEEDIMVIMVSEWFKTLKKHDRAKYRRAVKDLVEDFT